MARLLPCRVGECHLFSPGLQKPRHTIWDLHNVTARLISVQVFSPNPCGFDEALK